MKFRRVCDQLVPADDEAAELYDSLTNGDVVEVEVKVRKRRTKTQNNAMWRWFRELAQALNEAGYDIKSFPFKEGVEIPWDEDQIKKRLWVPVQLAMTGEKSTTKPLTIDYPAIYEVLSRKIAEGTGVHVPWPERLHDAA